MRSKEGFLCPEGEISGEGVVEATLLNVVNWIRKELQR
jgi:hypothetical protein